MPFNTRNARYLRISAHTVLPLYIYLDEKHVEWMSDYNLQRVLVDLKPEIGHKLRKESIAVGGSGGSANAKKGSVDVHRGDTYQFAYFFRKNEPHAVLIKSRKFIPIQNPSPLEEPTKDRHTPRKRRKGRSENQTTKATGGRKIGSRSRRKSVSEDEDEVMTDDLESDEDPVVVTEAKKLRRSDRNKVFVAGGYKGAESQDESDIDMHGPELNLNDDYAPENDESSIALSQHPRDHGESSSSQEPGPLSSQIFDIEVEEEEKPKMTLQISYRGFTIYDRCLCVVIEPWPPLRDASGALSRAPSRAPSLGLSEMRMSSVAPMDARGSVHSRERTPLFLPEIDPRRSITPAPLPSRIIPPVPLFDDVPDPQDDYEENEGEMMAFSQILKSVGDERAGSADEDEDAGDVFLGDADERRGGP